MHLLTELKSGYLSEVKYRTDEIPLQGEYVEAAYGPCIVANVSGLILDKMPAIYHDSKLHAVNKCLFGQLLSSAIVRYMASLERNFDPQCTVPYRDALVSTVNRLLSMAGHTLMQDNNTPVPQDETFESAYNNLAPLLHLQLEHCSDVFTVTDIIILRTAVLALNTIAFSSIENEGYDWADYPVLSKSDECGENVDLKTSYAENWLHNLSTLS